MFGGKRDARWGEGLTAILSALRAATKVKALIVSHFPPRSTMIARAWKLIIKRLTASLKILQRVWYS